MIEDAVLLLGVAGIGYFVYSKYAMQPAIAPLSAIDTAIAYESGYAPQAAIPGTPAAPADDTTSPSIWSDIQNFFNTPPKDTSAAANTNPPATPTSNFLDNFGSDIGQLFSINASTSGSGSALDLAKTSIIAHEGQRFDVYKDNLGILTVGVGHKVVAADGLKLGDTILQDRIDALFNNDISASYNAALRQAADLKNTDPKMIAALTEVNFQLGTGWPTKFPNTYTLIKQGNYAQAIKNLYNSAWYAQTPDRVEYFVAALQSTQPSQGVSV